MKKTHLFLIGLLAASLFACTLTSPPSARPSTDPPAIPSETPASRPVEPQESETAANPTVTSFPPQLTLDRNYFCNHGPGSDYLDVIDFPAGTVLPILATNQAGWWLVQIDDPRTSHTQCWIGVGVPSGDTSQLPFSSPTGGFVPVHDGTNWSRIIYLDYEHLERYT
jgi:hypothetical protein